VAGGNTQNYKNTIVKLTLTDNRIKIKAAKFLQNRIDKILDSKLSYVEDNSYYNILRVMRKGIFYDGIIHLYNSQDNSTYLGFKNYIIELLENELTDDLKKRNYNLKLKIIDKRNIPNIGANLKLDRLKNTELRTYQKQAVEYIIKEEICLIDLATGGGKTVIAAELIRRLNYKTLFVVNTIDLLNQTKKTFEKILGVKCGVITNGGQEWKEINIATIQTVVKFIKNENDEFLKNLHECNLIIVDECHFAKSESYNILMNNVKAQYRVGLSATPYTNNNSCLELYKSFGFPNFKVGLKNLIEKGYLIKPIIKFVKYKSENKYYINYEYAYKEVLKCRGRLLKLKEIVDYHKKRSDSILIITRRLEHAQNIKEILDGEVEIIEGKLSKRKREKLLKEMREGKRKILIGTDKIVSTGLDLPILNVLINYSANLSKIQTLQSLGRILRIYEGKEQAFMYDFYDRNEYLIKATKERIKVLEDEGFNIKIIDTIKA
jgi:superfamily II DNA or RNA helicase